MTVKSPKKPHVISEAAMALTTYCLASILMTITNKYVLGQHKFHLNLFLLAVQVSKKQAYYVLFQSFVCVLFLFACRAAQLLKFRQLRWEEGKTCKDKEENFLLIPLRVSRLPLAHPDDLDG